MDTWRVMKLDRLAGLASRSPKRLLDYYLIQGFKLRQRLRGILQQPRIPLRRQNAAVFLGSADSRDHSINAPHVDARVITSG